MSFSCDLETLNYLEQYSMLHRLKRSETIRYHITMGKVYLKVLSERPEVNVIGANDSKKREDVAGSVAS